MGIEWKSTLYTFRAVESVQCVIECILNGPFFLNQIILCWQDANSIKKIFYMKKAEIEHHEMAKSSLRMRYVFKMSNVLVPLLFAKFSS